MPTLLTDAPRATVEIGDGAFTFNRATSQDEDVALETAIGWALRILAADPLGTDFGIMPQSLADIALNIANGTRDIRAFAKTFFATALALQLQPELDGLMRTGADGEPRAMRPDRADLAWLLRQRGVQSQFLDKALSDVFTLETLGKPSGAGSATNAAPAPKSA